MFIEAGAAMFKLITTLVRRQSAAAAEAIAGLKAGRDAGQAAQAAQAQLAAEIATVVGGTMGGILFMPVDWWMRPFW